MKDCCGSSEADGSVGKCPQCGASGKAVSALTVKHAVRPEFLELAGKPGFRFCRTAQCDVVYFNAQGECLGKADLRVRVGLKESGDGAMLCYCFGFTEGMAREELRLTGRCELLEKIAVEVKAGHCACEVRNPQGSCCLGNVGEAIKRLARLAPAAAVGRV